MDTCNKNIPMKTACCICQKTKSQSGWVEQDISHHKVLSHGYCPECFLQAMKQIDIIFEGELGDVR